MISPADVLESIKAERNSIIRRKKVFGVGVNDAEFIVKAKLDGLHETRHPGYSAWKGILERSYCNKYKSRRPSYIGVEVCSKWLQFSEFNSWWKQNHVSGWHIDKDILCPGNKIYAPEFCIYIPQWLNSLTLDSKRSRGPYPIGVSAMGGGGYRSTLSISGRQISLGGYRTPDEAHAAWLSGKIEHIYDMKSEIDAIDDRLFDGVISIVRGHR